MRRDPIEVLNERDARLDASPNDVLTAYKITLDECSGWMFAGTTASEVAETIRNEIESNEGLAADEVSVMRVVPYETTQAEIDALPEFGGW